MDVKKTSSLRRFNFKRFTLTAVASALLALHAEVAKADSCPTEIAGTALANVICDFDTNSSVTVENGGTLGGISMNSYTPAAGQITINAGGLVSNSTATGIHVSSSTLSNGLVNNGTISTESISIGIDNSTIGNISNNGTIAATNGTGIKLNNSTINGSISNSGTISAGGVFEGIAILDGSVMHGNITNTGVIDGANGILIRNSTINGDLSNSGNIDASDRGISLGNAAHLTGDLTNSGSIIATGTTSTGISLRSASQISGSISNSGLISGGSVGLAVDSSSIGAGISNSGTIRGGTTGIAIEFTSAITGGISNSGVIQGGTNAIYVNPASSIDINILGQHARVIGNVDAANSNFNIASGATFTSEGDFNVNNFNIASNAVFNLNNSITAQNLVTNAGTLSVGNASRTINSANGYTQSTGGIFQTEISDGTHYGQLVVDNGVDLSQSGNVNVQLTSTSTVHSGEVFSNIISGNTVTGPTGGFNVTDNSFLWNFLANNTGTGVNLTATINPDAYNTCQGDYCQGAANTIIGQIAAGNSAFDAFNSLATEEEFQTAASQSTPELTNENIQAIQFITRSVMDVVPMWNTLHGASAGDAMLYQPNKVWVKPYGGTMTQNENNSVPGFNATAYGVVIGKDTQLTDDWLFGGAFAVGKDNMHGQSELSGQSIYSDAYQGILYGVRKFPNNVYFAGQGLVGYEDSNTNRSIPIYADTAKGSYGTWFTNLRAQLGWSTYELNQRLVLTPELDASYLFVNQGNYKESGSTMDLLVSPANNSSLVLGAYGNGAYRLTTFSNKQELTLSGYAGIARNILNSQPETTATFAAGGPSFSTYGTKFNEFVFRGGAGLTYANPIKPFAFSLSYDLQAGNNAYSGVGALTFTYKIK